MSDRARLTAWRDRRLGPLTFTLDGVLYEVPEHPARVWVMAILSDEPADLLLDLLPGDVAGELWEDAIDSEQDLDAALLERIGQSLLTRAAGRPWWQAQMLVATLVVDWSSYVAVARDRNLGDLLEWPIEDLCAWIYLRLTQYAKKEERARIDAALAHPPAGALVSEDDEAEPAGWDEGSGWMALAAQSGGGPTLA